MIYTVTLNPAVDRELSVESFEFDTVMRAVKWRVDCGGKGFNVARMLLELKTESIAMGFAGGKSGERLEHELRSLSIGTDFNWVSDETRTNISIVNADNSRYLKVNEPGPTISQKDLDALIQKIKDRVKPGDWWVLAGSLPPGVPEDIYESLVTIVENAGAHAVLDTSEGALLHGCKAGPYLIKPNDVEALQLIGAQPDAEVSLEAIAAEILERGPKNVIISLGKRGAFMAANGEFREISSPTITEKNPIGAGDSMVAGLVWALNERKPFFEAVQAGIACGAATAGQDGTDMGSYDTVIGLIAKMRALAVNA